MTLTFQVHATKDQQSTVSQVFHHPAAVSVDNNHAGSPETNGTTTTTTTIPFCVVFDDRWKTGQLDPRTWRVRLNTSSLESLVQLEFLTGTEDVLITLGDGRETEMKRTRGGKLSLLRKKRFGYEFAGESYAWTKKSSSSAAAAGGTEETGWELRRAGEEAVLASRSDSGQSEGVTTTVTLGGQDDNVGGPPWTRAHDGTAAIGGDVDGTGAGKAHANGNGHDAKPSTKENWSTGSGHSQNTTELPSPEAILMLATGLGIESACIDGGVLSSRPPLAYRSFGIGVGVAGAVNTGSTLNY